MKMSLNSALNLILQHIKPTKKSEFVPLQKAKGRINASSFYAKYPIPLHDISLRDGYAIKFDELANSPLKIKNLTKVNTGSYLKNRYACIVEKESVQNSIVDLDILKKALKQNFIKPKGEDIKLNELLLKKSDFINAFDIANLASQGISKVKVYKKMNIAYVSIGNEIIDVKNRYKKDFIFNSNGYALAARGESFGANTSDILVTKDDKLSIKETLDSLKDCDLVITIGGMSKNDSIDKLKDILLPIFRGVALAPAGLSGFSSFRSTPILHLPGLPMSSMLGFEILCAPLIYKFYGLTLNQIQGINAQISEDINHKKNSQSVQPGFFDGKFFLPIKVQAGMMNILNRCNGYILPKKNLKNGQNVIFYPFIAWNTTSF